MLNASPVIKPMPKVTSFYAHSSLKIIENDQSTPMTCGCLWKMLTGIRVFIRDKTPQLGRNLPFFARPHAIVLGSKPPSKLDINTTYFHF